MRRSFWLPVQSRGQMVLQGLADRTHAHRVDEFVAVDANGPTERGHFLRRRGAPDRRRGEVHLDRVARHGQRALVDLGDTGRVCQHQLHPPRRRYPQIARLCVQGPTVIAGPRLLYIAHERLADMAELDFLEVVERRDGRVFARALTGPNAEQGSEHSHAGMQVDHLASLWSADRGYPRRVAETLGLPERVHVCLFDLDGVLTDTASVHRKAWKQMFDAYLKARADSSGDQFVPFDIDADYRKYVDGKKREDGVRSFLDSRGISLEEGSPDDDAKTETVQGLGTRKNALFNQTLRDDGVEVFGGSRRYLEAVGAAGLGVAVVSSSSNAREVLEITGLDSYVQVRVDGQTMHEENIAGKPAPDSFLRAAQLLEASAGEAAVFEDALAGVAAGRAGDFGLVVGVDRTDQADELRRNGADVVVSDLAELLDS